MFDLAWSEIALIAVVALVVIGPKDLPEAVKGVARAIQKMRRMAGEFQSQVDEVAKDAGVQELRQSINEIRNFDIKGQIAKAVDKDGDLRSTFAQDPLGANPLGANPLYPAPDTLPPTPETPAPEIPARPEAPAFVPPGVAAATAPFVTAPPPPMPDVASSPTPQAPAPTPQAPALTPQAPAPTPQAPAFEPPAVSADAPRTPA